MEGIRFYADYGSAKRKREGGDAPNALAMFTGPEHTWVEYNIGGAERMYEVICSVFDYSDSPVAMTSASARYLRENCKRTSEAVARRIHPELFKRLDNGEV